jgi:uncharacterized membrane protein
MTRIHSAASRGSQRTGAASIEEMSLRDLVRRARRRITRRELLALPAALALLAPATPALAQTTTSTTGTSGYNQKPPTPTTKTEPTKEAKKEAEPSKETTTPKAATEPSQSASEPSTKASTLPFTGLNLAWVIGVGALLLGAGLSIRLALRTRTHR